MAGRQCHAFDVGDVPRADDQAAGVGIVANLIDNARDLVDPATIGRRPGTPLIAVDRSKFAVVVGPFIPDSDAVVVQVTNIRVASEKPQQLVDDALEFIYSNILLFVKNH